ncbi:hypothetical protein, partial [Brevibacterium sp. 2SA]|uniref:hypothetical protein n=1 Tax=Brevibacterium sp. 2SA TaxID=2502198 RepID=UPI001BB2A067
RVANFSPADRLLAGTTTFRRHIDFSWTELLANRSTSGRRNDFSHEGAERAAAGAPGAFARTIQSPAVTGSSAVRGPTVG